MNLNWWVILILGIWFSAAIGNFAQVNQPSPFVMACITTICIGIGYLIFR